MRRIAGVLGGMGPIATVDFLAKVISLTPAENDQEHVPLVVHQVPQIPDRSKAILCGSDAPFAPMLLGLQRLALAGAEFAVIPCNSAHHWYRRLVSEQSLRILHIADATWLELQRREMTSRTLAILATRGTLASNVYGERLNVHTRPLVPLDEPTQQLIDNSIAAIKAGRRDLAATAANEAASRAAAAGADCLILACTELPLALADSRMMNACVDSTLALARYCVAESLRAVSTAGPTSSTER